MSDIRKLTEIDLSELQLGEKLTIYRGSRAFLTGPGAAGYAGEATVLHVMKRSTLIELVKDGHPNRVYRLRHKDSRICRVPNGESTMLYVHARGGRPTVTAYFTDDEYELVKTLLAEEVITTVFTLSRRQRIARRALERMVFHDNLRNNVGRSVSGGET